MLEFVATENVHADDAIVETGEETVSPPVRDENGNPVCPLCFAHLLYMQEQIVHKEWVVEDVVIHYDADNLVEVDIPDEDVEGEIVDVVKYQVSCSDETCEYFIPAWQIHTVE